MYKYNINHSTIINSLINQKNKTGDFVNKFMKYFKGGLLDHPELVPVDEPDIPDAYDRDILNEFTEQDFIENEQMDEFDEQVQEAVDEKEQFLGFDIDPSIDFINEDLQQDIVDIGIKGDVRGREYEYKDFEQKDFININKKNTTKILLINDRNSFDTFTSRYGELNKKEDKIFINWKNVANDYKGIYISSSSLGFRDDDIPYKDIITKENWLDYDYNYIDKVIIFKKTRDIIYEKHIDKPFNGKVVDEYAISEEEFVDIHEENAQDKILLIADVADFDKFTNIYGSINTSHGKTYININWRKVNRDYDGFYIDKDNDFYDDRYRRAFFNGKKYNSWLKHDKILNGIVYLFNYTHSN